MGPACGEASSTWPGSRLVEDHPEGVALTPARSDAEWSSGPADKRVASVVLGTDVSHQGPHELRKADSAARHPFADR